MVAWSRGECARAMCRREQRQVGMVGEILLVGRRRRRARRSGRSVPACRLGVEDRRMDVAKWVGGRW